MVMWKVVFDPFGSREEEKGAVRLPLKSERAGFRD